MKPHVHVVETEAGWQAVLAAAHDRLRRGEAEIARYEAEGKTVFAEATRQSVERLRKAVEEISRDRAEAISRMPRCQCGGAR